VFEIKNDNGKFIYPNQKMYIGVVELEITNNTYFNIDSKEYSFDTEEKFNFKITSMCDNHISKSKKLRIETSPFECSEKAMNAINSYLNNFRISLLKRDFSYRIPLNSKLEEVCDPRRCVGVVEIKLENGERLEIKEKERFHIENELWYRLYSTQNCPIIESDVICVETSAYAETENAKQALDVIRPKLERFLKDSAIKCSKISEARVDIYMSGNFCIGLHASATMSKRVPFDIQLSKSNLEDIYLCSVLALLEHKGFEDLPNLYNILELIEKDMRESSQDKNREKIEENGLSNKDDIEKFTYSVNRVDVVGLEHVRHGAKFKGNPNPEKALTIEKCKRIMKDFVCKWLDFKMKPES